MRLIPTLPIARHAKVYINGEAQDRVFEVDTDEGWAVVGVPRRTGERDRPAVIEPPDQSGQFDRDGLVMTHIYEQVHVEFRFQDAHGQEIVLVEKRTPDGLSQQGLIEKINGLTRLAHHHYKGARKLEFSHEQALAFAVRMVLSDLAGVSVTEVTQQVSE